MVLQGRNCLLLFSFSPCLTVCDTSERPHRCAQRRSGIPFLFFPVSLWSESAMMVPRACQHHLSNPMIEFKKPVNRNKTNQEVNLLWSLSLLFCPWMPKSCIFDFKSRIYTKKYDLEPDSQIWNQKSRSQNGEVFLIRLSY